MSVARIHCEVLRVPVSRQTAARLRSLAAEVEAELPELASQLLEECAISYVEMKGGRDAEKE